MKVWKADRFVVAVPMRFRIPGILRDSASGPSLAFTICLLFSWVLREPAVHEDAKPLGASQLCGLPYSATGTAVGRAINSYSLESPSSGKGARGFRVCASSGAPYLKVQSTGYRYLGSTYDLCRGRLRPPGFTLSQLGHARRDSWCEVGVKQDCASPKVKRRA